MIPTYLFWGAYCFGIPAYMVWKKKIGWRFAAAWAVMSVAALYFVCWMHAHVGMQ